MNWPAIVMISILGIVVAVMLVGVLGSSRKRTPLPPAFEARPAPEFEISNLCPTMDYDPFSFTAEIPSIPRHVFDPFLFRDAKLGFAMFAGVHVAAEQLNDTFGGYVPARIEKWLFRVHGDHWCTVRKATVADLAAIRIVKEYTGSLPFRREA